MRKIILYSMVSLDGFFEGANHTIDWHKVDGEFNEFAEDQLNSVDTIIFGRKTYELMAGYWTSEEALTNDSIIAKQMTAKSKIVFSRTMAKAEWENTRLINKNGLKEIEILKHQPGKNLIIFGSACLASTFHQLDLIDEYRIVLNPIILGQGIPLFKHYSDRLNLKLINTRVFTSGNVLLCYEPKQDNSN